MFRTVLFLAVTLACLAEGAAMNAASTSELLEKGIYTEETVGDLDKAITIYEKVVAEAKASHALAARAQFRLGQCLLKKGKKTEAAAAFQKVIDDFSDQKELVAKARKFIPEGIQLQPVPWVDGETMQLNMRLVGGMEIGTIVYTAASAKLDDRKIWKVGSRTMVTLSAANGTSCVAADWDTFRPIQSSYKMTPVMGSFTVKYLPTQLVVTADGPMGKSTKTIEQSQIVYDNEQAMDVMRRLPLAAGYKTTLPILGIGGSIINLPIEVQGKESVKVPAGEFECFKIHLGLVNQTFWYSTDPHRYLVKFDATAVVAELTAIGQDKPGELRRFEDQKLGLSLASPNEWFFFAPSAAGKGEARIFLLDPQAIATCVLSVVKLSDLKPEEQKSLRAWADATTVERSKAEENYKVRGDSWHEEKIAGVAALSYVADYGRGKEKMVDYRTFLRGQSMALKFAVTIPQEQFEGFRKTFDTIVESLKVK